MEEIRRQPLKAGSPLSPLHGSWDWILQIVSPMTCTLSHRASSLASNQGSYLPSFITYPTSSTRDETQCLRWGPYYSDTSPALKKKTKNKKLNPELFTFTISMHVYLPVWASVMGVQCLWRPEDGVGWLGETCWMCWDLNSNCLGRQEAF